MESVKCWIPVWYHFSKYLQLVCLLQNDLKEWFCKMAIWQVLNLDLFQFCACRCYTLLIYNTKRQKCLCSCAEIVLIVAFVVHWGLSCRDHMLIFVVCLLFLNVYWHLQCFDVLLIMLTCAVLCTDEVVNSSKLSTALESTSETHARTLPFCNWISCFVGFSTLKADWPI